MVERASKVPVLEQFVAEDKYSIDIGV